MPQQASRSWFWITAILSCLYGFSLLVWLSFLAMGILAVFFMGSEGVPLNEVLQDEYLLYLMGVIVYPIATMTAIISPRKLRETGRVTAAWITLLLPLPVVLYWAAVFAMYWLEDLSFAM